MSEYVPCKSLPSVRFPWWIRTAAGGISPCIPGSPLLETGSTLSNCVGWAWGRYQQIHGSVDPRLPASSAGSWYRQAQAAGMSTGSTPALGAVLCLGGGHVAIVEEIADDGTFINCSESDYGGAAFTYRTRYRANNYELSVGGFQGFIYNDSFDPPPGPGPDPEPPDPEPEDQQKFRWWMFKELFDERRNQ